MQDWHGAFLGRRRLPRELSAFELEAFFGRWQRLAAAVDYRSNAAVPPMLWRHLGAQFTVAGPLAARDEG
jgi:hypothetical protein